MEHLKHLSLYAYILFTVLVKLQLQALLVKYFDANPFMSLLTKSPCISYPKFGNI